MGGEGGYDLTGCLIRRFAALHRARLVARQRRRCPPVHRPRPHTRWLTLSLCHPLCLPLFRLDRDYQSFVLFLTYLPRPPLADLQTARLAPTSPLMVPTCRPSSPSPPPPGAARRHHALVLLGLAHDLDLDHVHHVHGPAQPLSASLALYPAVLRRCSPLPPRPPHRPTPAHRHHHHSSRCSQHLQPARPLSLHAVVCL